MSFMREAVNEWASVVGSENRFRAFLLSDFDSWERNPYYVGPPVGDPEDGPWIECYGSYKEAAGSAKYLASLINKPVKMYNYMGRCWVVERPDSED